MNSFEFEVSEKELAGAEMIELVSRQLIAALVQQGKSTGMTKAKLAAMLEVDKSTISRMLRGNANLTLRSVGELCWAMDVEPAFSCPPFSDELGNGDIRPATPNPQPKHSTVVAHWGTAVTHAQPKTITQVQAK